MLHGAPSEGSIRALEKKWENQTNLCIEFLKTAPNLNKSIKELKAKREMLEQELQRKRNVK